MSKKRFFILLVLFACLVGRILFFKYKNYFPSHEAPTLPITTLKASPGFFLTSEIDGLKPQDTFPCVGTIFARFAFADVETGVHQLDGVWRRPDGEIQERPRITLNFLPGSQRKFYVYLTLKEPDRFLSSEKTPFAGDWTFEAYVDGLFMGRTRFKVSC